MAENSKTESVNRKSLGKRGRGTPQSREATYGSDKSYDKYFKKHGKDMKMMPSNLQESLNPSLNKSWIKENLKQNKDYEKVNKVSVKSGEWDTVFDKASKRGVKTNKLEAIARRSDNPHEMKEYGFKPHVKQVMKTYDELKQGGYLPNVKISGFDVVLKNTQGNMVSSGVYGAYRVKTGEYVINANALSVPRIEKAMRSNKLAGKSYQDVVIHELGHGVYFQNMVKPIVMKQGGKKSRVAFSPKQKAVRSAYAKLNNELRKNLRTTNMQGLSSYVSNKASGRKKATTKAERVKNRRSAYVEGFAEGYVNYYRHRKYGETLHPVGQAVGSFLKEINKYK